MVEDDESVRKAISKVCLTMAVCTLIFKLVPLTAINAFGLVAKTSGWAVPTTEMVYVVRLLAQYLVGMPLIIFLLSRLPGKMPERHKIKGKQYLGIVAASFGILIACNYIGLMVSTGISALFHIHATDTGVLDLLTEIDVSEAMILVSVCGPVYEELIFRRMLVTRLMRYGEGVAMVLSALMFGIFHGNWNQFIYAFGFGMFLAFVFMKTGDIRITMSLHVIVNFCGSVLLASLMKWAQFEHLARLMLQGEHIDVETILLYASEHGPQILCLYLYVFLEMAVAVTGFILLLVFRKQMKLDAGEYQASRKKKASVMFLNLGMLLFLVVWSAVILLANIG